MKEELNIINEKEEKKIQLDFNNSTKEEDVIEIIKEIPLQKFNPLKKKSSEEFIHFSSIINTPNNSQINFKNTKIKGELI